MNTAGFKKLMANHFSPRIRELGMKMAYNHANKMAKSKKGKVDKVYIDMNKELFKMR